MLWALASLTLRGLCYTNSHEYILYYDDIGFVARVFIPLPPFSLRFFSVELVVLFTTTASDGLNERLGYTACRHPPSLV